MKGWWTGSSSRVLLSMHENLTSNPTVAKKKIMKNDDQSTLYACVKIT
jgi:hypothetical protein